MTEAPITVATFNRVSSHLVLNHNFSIRPQILHDLGIEKDLMDSVKKTNDSIMSNFRRRRRAIFYYVLFFIVTVIFWILKWSLGFGTVPPLIFSAVYVLGLIFSSCPIFHCGTRIDYDSIKDGYIIQLIDEFNKKRMMTELLS